MIRIKSDVMLTERELESTRKPARRVPATSTFKEKKEATSVKRVYDHSASNLGPRAHLFFGQHKDTELCNNQFHFQSPRF